MKYPEYAERKERCPWCQNLKQGRCSGCGQVYGKVVAAGSVARRGAARRGNFKSSKGDLLSPTMPPVEVSRTTASNAGADAPPTAPQPAPPPVVLVLPEPPSSNVWWRRAGMRMHLSHEAREYKRDVFRRAGVNGAPIFPSGDVSVVVVWRRSMKSGDLDKRLGILLDALQSIRQRMPDESAPGKMRLVVTAPGVYDSDKQVAMIWARRYDEHNQLEPGTVRVEISQVRDYISVNPNCPI